MQSIAEKGNIELGFMLSFFNPSNITLIILLFLHFPTHKENVPEQQFSSVQSWN